MLEYLKRTSDSDEIIEIGRKIAAEKNDIYTPSLVHKMMNSIEEHIPDADSQTKEDMLYHAIYDWWVYGSNVDEEFYLHFYEKTDEEKRGYMVNKPRMIYCDHLNSGGGKEIRQGLADKYRLYQRLKPYYKREMIAISGEENDFEVFSDFVSRHPVFVVKPSNFWWGLGVHKASLDMYGNDPRRAYDSILNEGTEIIKLNSSRNPKMVLEELIVQDESMARLHEASVNAIRATAVRGKDGKIHVYHPWLKAGMNGTFVASAVLNGFDAEIDAETGIVISDGFQESGNIFEVHPDSGIRIKGFQIPRWQEMLTMVDELMALLPEYGYVGWDLVLTPDGWVVMEGNYAGEFMFQLINGRGYLREFEDLIGWKLDKEFWWQ